MKPTNAKKLQAELTALLRRCRDQAEALDALREIVYRATSPIGLFFMHSEESAEAEQAAVDKVLTILAEASDLPSVSFGPSDIKKAIEAGTST